MSTPSKQMFDRLRSLPFHLDDAAKKTLAAALNEYGGQLGIRGDAASMFTASESRDVLIYVRNDYDGAGFFLSVPAAKVDEQLSNDLALLHGKVFAGGADLEPVRWDAALRVMSAIGLEMDDADAMAEWGSDQGSALTVEDLAPLWHRWVGSDVKNWTQLSQAPSRLCAFNRAM